MLANRQRTPPRSILKRKSVRRAKKKVRFSPYVKEPGHRWKELQEESDDEDEEEEEEEEEVQDKQPRIGRKRTVTMTAPPKPVPAIQPPPTTALFQNMSVAFGNAFTLAVDSVDNMWDMFSR